MDVLLTGGPFDGQAFVMVGGLPSYLMLVEHPAQRVTGHPLIVGAGFDDHWPGQQRYDLLATGDGEAAYRYAPPEWLYRAVSARAVVGFVTVDGEVVRCAPYVRRLVLGLREATAIAVLERAGFEVRRA
jgi:hypothetical protein